MTSLTFYDVTDLFPMTSLTFILGTAVDRKKKFPEKLEKEKEKQVGVNISQLTTAKSTPEVVLVDLPALVFREVYIYMCVCVCVCGYMYVYIIVLISPTYQLYRYRYR